MAATTVGLLTSHAVGASPRGIIWGNRNALGIPNISSFQLRGRGRAASRRLTLQCQAENKPRDVEPNSAVEPPEASSIPTPVTNIKVKRSSFWDILAFKGPAPERINGRLAMIGFVSALAVEVAGGQDLAAQITNGGALWFVGTAVLFSTASLVPLFQGVDAPERSNGLMTADAELWNGRFAMLGLVGLAFTEFLKGGPLV